MVELRGIEVPGLFKIPSLVFKPGEKVLIYGPSGCGKSTLLHLMGGLWQSSRGDVLYQGQNLNTLADETLSELRRESIGFVFQKMNLLEHMTCEENLRLVRSSAVTAERAAESLKKVGLESKLDTRAGVLSLGEQQRLAVARVLLQGPALILADEPTSSLDEKNSHKIIELLIEAAKEKTLIVISHDSRLQKYFDRSLNFEEWVR